MKTRPIAIYILILICIQSYSQVDSAGIKNTDFILEPYHKNVIKFNPTPMMFFGDLRNITFSYERLVMQNQSVTFQIGYLTFPDIFGDTLAGLINFTDDSKQSGINLAFDYRYYPGIRNRRPAPDGVFIGGYISYYGFRYDNSFDILGTGIDQNNTINGNVNIMNLGFDLGYQFVFWKRMTVDLLVFGPSLNYTQSSGEITGDLNEEQIGMIDDEIIKKLMDKYPGLNAVFSEENLSFSGSRSSFGTGFRYAIQIGFHF